MQFDNQGIIIFDISKYQGYPPKFPVVNFQRMRDYGASAVIIKASQRNYPDPAFYFNWAAARGVISRSSYHYFDNGYSAILQAAQYWNTIKDDLEGICWLDLEDRNDGWYRGWIYWYDFLETWKIISRGAPIGIYTAYYYWTESLLSATYAQREYFHQYPLWLADYGARGSDPLKPDFPRKVVPKPWHDGDCVMVQTGTPVIGLAAGVYSYEIDLNYFNGGLERFREFFKPVADLVISIRS